MMMIDIDELIEYSKDLKLLYVEDNPDAREMTAMILEDFFDNIILAVDGEDGLEKFKDNDIDFVISDINMPKLNGIDMCEKIREIDQEVSLVILSAHNEDNFFMKSIKMGIDAYLLKPIDIDQLTSVIYKITQKYRYESEAKSNMHFLKMYQKATNESSIVSKTDAKGIITYVNDAFCDITGYTKEELIGKNHNIVRHPDNPKSIFEDMWHTIRDKKEIWKGIVRNRAKNSKSYYVDSLVMPIIDVDGTILEYISLRNDITDIMNPVKQLSSAIKNSKNPILIYMKLDEFDMIEEFYDNDTVELLQDRVTHYLQEKFSEIYDFDKIYQLGNGEYAFIIDYLKYAKDEDRFIEKLKKYQDIIKNSTVGMDIIEYDISILLSIVYDKSKILESAKLGIKKLLKTKKYFIIANNLAKLEQEKAKENMKVVSMIKEAIYNSKIVSYFQPIIDNKTKNIVKYESLVRLIDKDDKIITPFFFLETSKKSNYYSQITAIVLEHSFTVLKNCDFEISINLSAIDIEQKVTREKILKLLDTYKEYSARVIFELLEDEAIKDFEIIKQFITKVKGYGVKIAIDDFGAGYSNYERLLDYQPDILKIDGCLIRDIETSSYSLSVVKSIVTFAKEQNIQTVAEFIENESKFNIVKELGVDFSQGYYFGKPEPLKL
jgi:PAS domain S-box-containing protein